jgi:hypothetical protein
MDKDIDALMRTPFVDVPDDFTQSVMQRVQLLPLPRHRPRLLKKLQALALITGGILGAMQLVAFMFGILAASTAG